MHASFATLFAVLFMVILSFIQMSGIYNMLLNVTPGERERDQRILCKKNSKKSTSWLLQCILAVIQYNTGLFMMFNNIQKCIKYKKREERKIKIKYILKTKHDAYPIAFSKQE